MDSSTDEAILLDNNENVEIKNNITKTDTYSKYYSQCDFDGDGIDDLFLATGTTWWFSSSGKFHWTFLNTSSKQLKDLRFGYFDDDDRCDVITESDSGRWMISSGGTAPWKPLEQVWLPGAWKPLKDVWFGRFDPNDLSRSRRTTHAFFRKDNGEWWVKKLSDPAFDWEYVGGLVFSDEQAPFWRFHGRWCDRRSCRREWALGDFRKRPQTMARTQSPPARPGRKPFHR